MSSHEMPYHCEECGFCRVGGRENFTHCDECGMCIDTQLFDDHNCKAGKYMSNCPICQEDLFSSRFASHEMPCGHAIHWDCFKELTSYDTRCPVCKKTAESPEQMQATWSAIAMGIALQPVPGDMARVVNIFCNDCEVSDHNRRWHFLGVRCNGCLSFNTVVEQIMMQGQEAADFLDDIEENQQNIADAGIPISITASASTSPYSFDQYYSSYTNHDSNTNGNTPWNSNPNSHNNHNDDDDEIMDEDI
jgi:Zinc-ribbon/Ring finger domain